MRDDMARVIVGRPRVKPWSSPKGRTAMADFDDMPSRQGMRRPHILNWSGKELNENLKPLRRYLASQVGRPWNKVYSEIAAHLRASSTVQQHVRDHLFRDFVAVMPRRNVEGRRSHWRSNGLWWQDFYVDPRTGFLCRTGDCPEERARQRAERNRPKPPVERAVLSPDRELRLLNGLWYEVQLAPLPKPIYRTFRETVKRALSPWSRNNRFFEAEMDVRRLESAPVRDAVTGKLIEAGPPIDAPESRKEYRRVQPQMSYAVRKRVLSRKELGSYRLSNPASS